MKKQENRKTREPMKKQENTTNEKTTNETNSRWKKTNEKTRKNMRTSTLDGSVQYNVIGAIELVSIERPFGDVVRTEHNQV